MIVNDGKLRITWGDDFIWPVRVYCKVEQELDLTINRAAMLGVHRAVVTAFRRPCPHTTSPPRPPIHPPASFRRSSRDAPISRWVRHKHRNRVSTNKSQYLVQLYLAKLNSRLLPGSPALISDLTSFRIWWLSWVTSFTCAHSIIKTIHVPTPT